MPSSRKSLMRCLGEFVGHVVRGAKTDPARARRHEVRREEKVERRGNIVLRRTVVEEVECRDTDDEK